MNKISKLFSLLKYSQFISPLLRYGVAAGVEHLPALQTLAALGVNTVVDIGANRGQFALAARASFPQAVLHSFEPLAEPAECFAKVFKNDSRTTLHTVAIGNAEEETNIHVSKSDDSSSMLPISALQSTLFKNTEEKETRHVAVKPLGRILSADDIGNTALLKIDVQGFEKQVIDGTGSLVQRFAAVYVECSFMELYTGQVLAGDIIALLGDQGFCLRGVYNMSYDTNGTAVQGDFLFLHSDAGRGTAKD
jgi:FkbM family methyltransferase